MQNTSVTNSMIIGGSVVNIIAAPSKKLMAGGTDDLLMAEEGGIQMSSFKSSSTALPPQWVDDVDAVHAELAEIVRMMGILQSLHSSRVGSVFGKDLDDMEGKIEKLTQDVTGTKTFLQVLSGG